MLDWKTGVLEIMCVITRFVKNAIFDSYMTSYLSTVLGNFHSDGFWFRQADTFLFHFVIFLLMFKAQSLEYKYFFVVVCGLWTATSVTQR